MNAGVQNKPWHKNEYVIMFLLLVFLSVSKDFYSAFTKCDCSGSLSLESFSAPFPLFLKDPAGCSTVRFVVSWRRLSLCQDSVICPLLVFCICMFIVSSATFGKGLLLCLPLFLEFLKADFCKVSMYCNLLWHFVFFRYVSPATKNTTFGHLSSTKNMQWK